MELKKKKVTSTDRTELVLVLGAPEIDLLWFSLGQEIEPRIIGNADVEFHRIGSSNTATVFVSQSVM